ncbi:MAG: uracil phosphoribosyltransferase [Nitrososphaerota archaeon]|nr:uracil phosphoribosyltransferase [Nitrososphaerota archaeon]MDG6939820.1 uracil phosphoribosyltransferase [Nitrososphaerota archaeon]
MSAGSFAGRVHVIDHPLAQTILTSLRDRRTDQITFRKGMVKVGRLLGYEIIRRMPVNEVQVETPLGTSAKGISIPDLDRIVIVNVLRAAMPLVEGLLKAFPLARQGVMAVQRVEEKEGVENIRAVRYFAKTPVINADDTVIIADPMLATGSTILEVMEEVRKAGSPKKVMITSIISCEYGIARVMSAVPSVELFTLAVDRELNSRGYIVPGLGDAGDRSFG